MLGKVGEPSNGNPWGSQPQQVSNNVGGKVGEGLGKVPSGKRACVAPVRVGSQNTTSRRNLSEPGNQIKR